MSGTSDTVRQARIVTFASSEVRKLLDARLEASPKIVSRNVDHAGQGYETRLDLEYQELARTLGASVDALVAQIRAELSTAG